VIGVIGVEGVDSRRQGLAALAFQYLTRGATDDEVGKLVADAGLLQTGEEALGGERTVQDLARLFDESLIHFMGSIGQGFLREQGLQMELQIRALCHGDFPRPVVFPMPLAQVRTVFAS